MLKLKRFDEGVWYDYESGIRLKIKPVSKWDLVNVRSRAKRKIAIQGSNGEDIISEDIDQGVFMTEIFKIALLQWEGIPFEGKNKPGRQQALESIFEDEPLRDFVMRKSMSAFDSELIKLEEELKNSESSQSGVSSSGA